MSAYAAFVLVFVACCVRQRAADICVTPKSLEGNCTQVQNCEELERIMARPHLDSEAAEMIKRLQCGFDDFQPKICCPTSTNATKQYKPAPIPLGKELSLPSLSLRFASDDLLPAEDECGEQTAEGDRIYDGVVTELGEFPWAALLKYRTPYGDGYACGGALISERYVLTAGHCVKGRAVEQTGKLIAVTLGEYDVKKTLDCDPDWGELFCAPPVVDVAVESYVAHPEYEPGSADRHHDIALVRLAKPVSYSDFVQPICLPPKNATGDPPRIKKVLYVTGWGETQNIWKWTTE